MARRSFTRAPPRSGRVELHLQMANRRVALGHDAMGVEHQEHLGAAAPLRITLDVAQLRAKHGKGVFKVNVADDEGMTATIDAP